MSTKLLPPGRNSAARLIPGVGNLIHMNKVSQLVSKISSIFLLTIVHSRQTAVPNLPITSTMHSPTKTLFFFLTLLPDVTQLETFLQEIKDGTIMLVATYDDAATK